MAGFNLQYPLRFLEKRSHRMLNSTKKRRTSQHVLQVLQVQLDYCYASRHRKVRNSVCHLCMHCKKVRTQCVQLSRGTVDGCTKCRGLQASIKHPEFVPFNFTTAAEYYCCPWRAYKVLNVHASLTFMLPSGSVSIIKIRLGGELIAQRGEQTYFGYCIRFQVLCCFY